MKSLHLIHHLGDCYEITTSDNTIIKIVKLLGGTQVRSEVNFDDLSERVQNLVIKELSHE